MGGCHSWGLGQAVFKHIHINIYLHPSVRPSIHFSMGKSNCPPLRIQYLMPNRPRFLDAFGIFGASSSSFDPHNELNSLPRKAHQSLTARMTPSVLNVVIGLRDLITSKLVCLAKGSSPIKSSGTCTSGGTSGGCLAGASRFVLQSSRAAGP